jgi:hypothetical protein
MSEDKNKSKVEVKFNGAVSAKSVAEIREGLVSGSNVQQVRTQIEQPKKPK